MAVLVVATRPRHSSVWEPVCLLQGFDFGPFGLEVEKKSENESLGPLGPGGPKSPKRSRERVKIDYSSTISTRFRLRFGLFGAPGSRGPGDSCSDFFLTLGPKGPNDPCSRQTGSQSSVAMLRQEVITGRDGFEELVRHAKKSSIKSFKARPKNPNSRV